MTSAERGLMRTTALGSIMVALFACVCTASTREMPSPQENQPELATIAGSVINFVGEREPNIKVTIERKTGGGVSTSADSDASGSFKVAVPAGDYRVAVTLPGFYEFRGDAAVSPGSTTVVLVILVPSGGRFQSLVGRVLDRTGRPVSGAWVTVQGPPGVVLPISSALAGGDGTFKFENVSSYVPYTVTAVSSEQIGAAISVVPGLQDDRQPIVVRTVPVNIISKR